MIEAKPTKRIAVDYREIISQPSQLFEPIDILSHAIRAYGLKYEPDLLGGRLSSIFMLSSRGLESVMGVRLNPDSPFHFDGDDLWFKDANSHEKVDVTIRSLSRGWRPDFYFKGRVHDNNQGNETAVLNINFSQFCNNRCKFCVRTYMDDRPEDYAEVSIDHVKEVIEKASQVTPHKNLSDVEQISIVSGLRSEHITTENIGSTLAEIYKTAHEHSFTGKIMYAGYQMEKKDVEIIADNIPNFIWYKTIEAFDHRKTLMPSPKGSQSSPQIVEELREVQQRGLEVSYFYIAGLDNLEVMNHFMKEFNFVDKPPNVNLFDVYNKEEWNIQDSKFASSPLEYIRESAEIISNTYYEGNVPDRGTLDSGAGFWAMKKGSYQPKKAYVIGEYWNNNSFMGPQGLVNVI